MISFPTPRSCACGLHAVFQLVQRFAGRSGIEDRRYFIAAQGAIVDRRFVDAAVEERDLRVVLHLAAKKHGWSSVNNCAARRSTGDLDAIDVEDLLFSPIVKRVG